MKELTKELCEDMTLLAEALEANEANNKIIKGEVARSARDPRARAATYGGRTDACS